MRIGRFGELGGGYVAKPLKKCLTITGHPLFKSEFLGVLYSLYSYFCVFFSLIVTPKMVDRIASHLSVRCY